MERRHGADFALACFKGEPSSPCFGDAFFDAEQRLRRRAAEADQYVGVGKFDLPQDERAGRFAIPEGWACDCPADARARCWRCTRSYGLTRSPSACGQAICRIGRRMAGLRCLRHDRELRRQASALLQDCRRRTRAGSPWVSARSLQNWREWCAAHRVSLRFLPPNAPA